MSNNNARNGAYRFVPSEGTTGANGAYDFTGAVQATSTGPGPGPSTGNHLRAFPVAISMRGFPTQAGRSFPST